MSSSYADFYNLNSGGIDPNMQLRDQFRNNRPLDPRLTQPTPQFQNALGPSGLSLINNPKPKPRPNNTRPMLNSPNAMNPFAALFGGDGYGDDMYSMMSMMGMKPPMKVIRPKLPHMQIRPSEQTMPQGQQFNQFQPQGQFVAKQQQQMPGSFEQYMRMFSNG